MTKKDEKTRRQRMAPKTLHRKLQMEQHESHYKEVMHSPSTSDNNKYAQLTVSFIVLALYFLIISYINLLR